MRGLLGKGRKITHVPVTCAKLPSKPHWLIPFQREDGILLNRYEKLGKTSHQKPEGFFHTQKFSKMQILSLCAMVFKVHCWYFSKNKYLKLQRYKTNRTPKVTGKDRIFVISTSF